MLYVLNMLNIFWDIHYFLNIKVFLMLAATVALSQSVRSLHNIWYAAVRAKQSSSSSGDFQKWNRLCGAAIFSLLLWQPLSWPSSDIAHPPVFDGQYFCVSPQCEGEEGEAAWLLVFHQDCGGHDGSSVSYTREWPWPFFSSTYNDHHTLKKFGLDKKFSQTQC